MYGLLLHKTFLFSKVKIISELGNADCGLLSLATSVGLTRLQLTPRNSERDMSSFKEWQAYKHDDRS